MYKQLNNNKIHMIVKQDNDVCSLPSPVTINDELKKIVITVNQLHDVLQTTSIEQFFTFNPQITKWGQKWSHSHLN
ncbi:hypothetical protein T4B_14949 [Trichinella pseudospiralis]|uniref:Uncharacterized protein n=1 Tax=Trichinella pseudospiralis TaxID=6337 RepID=A0A0V1H9Y3_TRIPS|nr:hypothetical protein T4B_14949 [Trichinella pseudospiralis]